MDYPIPKDKELFILKIEQNPSNWFSRDEKTNIWIHIKKNKQILIFV